MNRLLIELGLAALLAYSAYAAGYAEGKAATTGRQAVAAVAGSEVNRAEGERRLGAQQGVIQDADKSTLQAHADSGTADHAAAGLRERTVATAARCHSAPTDPTPAEPGPPASAPGDLLADVQRRLDEAAGELAAYADSARIAGTACERSYDALTPDSR